jgi:mono/diheme cytochrome c family protein
MKFPIVALALIGFAAAGVFRSTVRAQQPVATTATTWDGVFTEEQAKRGNVVYTEKCANCHGTELEGMDMSPPLSGAAFTAGWNELTIGDLFERIRISMPSDNPGTLPRAEIADVIAYMLSANKFPAGKEELSQQLPMLKQIQFLASKP